MSQDEQKAEKEGRQPANLLNRTTAIVVGIGALLAAILGVLSQLGELREKVFGPGTDTVAEEPVAIRPQEDQEACCDITIRHPDVIPLHLFPRLPHREHFPYWFKVEAENRCAQALTIEIEFGRYRGPFEIEADSTIFSDTLPRGSYSRRIDPEVTISNYHAEEPMSIKWSVRDDRGTLLKKGTTHIDLLPRSTIAWDLKNADQKPVSQEYLLASLAAWTETPFPSVDELAESCGGNGAGDGLEPSWLRGCYQRLFASPSPVFFSQRPMRFPESGHQTVLSPPVVLEKRQANQLEAALLLASVGRLKGPRFRLVGRPQDGDAELKSFLLAWQSAPGADWQAVDLARPPSVDLGDNLREATAELARLRANRPEIFLALDTTGVYLDRFYAVIDFARADHHHHIGRLPS